MQHHRPGIAKCLCDGHEIELLLTGPYPLKDTLTVRAGLHG